MIIVIITVKRILLIFFFGGRTVVINYFVETISETGKKNVRFWAEVTATLSKSTIFRKKNSIM